MMGKSIPLNNGQRKERIFVVTVVAGIWTKCIRVIFSWAQIGRSAIFGREIGVPDREIFSREKIFKFNVKNCLFASP